MYQICYFESVSSGLFQKSPLIKYFLSFLLKYLFISIFPSLVLHIIVTLELAIVNSHKACNNKSNINSLSCLI